MVIIHPFMRSHDLGKCPHSTNDLYPGPKKSHLKQNLLVSADHLELAAPSGSQYGRFHALSGPVQHPVEMHAVDAKPMANTCLVLLPHVKTLQDLAIAFFFEISQDFLHLFTDLGPGSLPERTFRLVGDQRHDL